MIVPMPRLVARICRRRVNAVNHATRKLSRRYGSILLETRSLEGIYSCDKWHVDRMHPSRIGHQFIADNYAAQLRKRGFEIGDVEFSSMNNRSRRDSIIWMVKNGTPWFLKRSLDLLPAIIFLSIVELVHIARHGLDSEGAEIIFPEFFSPQRSHNRIEKERVS
jgi:hypothetical protein